MAAVELEQELQEQLQEQQEALTSLKQLVDLDPSPESAALLEELEAGIRETEASSPPCRRQRCRRRRSARQPVGPSTSPALWHSRERTHRFLGHL